MGDGHSKANDLNDKGVAVGASIASDENQRRAVLWREGVATQLAGEGEAMAINSADRVVGTGHVSGGGPHAFSVNGDGTDLVDLRTLPRQSESAANGLPRNGFFPVGKSGRDGFFGGGEAGAMSALPRPGGSIAAEARAVNDDHVICGTIWPADNVPQACVWRPSTFGGFRFGQLPTLPGWQTASAVAISGDGNMVGGAGMTTQVGQVRTRACLWKARGDVHDLGALRDGGNSFATGVALTAFGVQVVGGGDSANSGAGAGAGDHVAVLWRNGTMYDLNKCIGRNSGWTLREATAINIRGWIVGYGVYKNAQGRGFLLIPVP